MSEKAMNEVLYAAAVVVAMMVLAPSGQAQSVNYNSSKSNSGNSPAPTPTACPGGSSKTATGACPPAASSAPSMDPNSGAVTGRRQHEPVTVTR